MKARTGCLGKRPGTQSNLKKKAGSKTPTSSAKLGKGDARFRLHSSVMGKQTRIRVLMLGRWG